MLSHEENELLSRVGKGTPMGILMRRMWIPACRSPFLEAGGAPRRLRLLGEDLVAFRVPDGRVGVREEACPHRRCSLALARNEDGGLRCIYHGWKFDVSGDTIDVPTEPKERQAAFAATIPKRHHPVREAGGIIWIWMGEDEPGPFLNFNWLDIPVDQIQSRVGTAKCSWLNGLETALDSAHVGILHTNSLTDPTYVHKSDMVELCTDDMAPHFEFETQDYGYREAALRHTNDGGKYARVREFVMPFFSFIPVGPRTDDQLVTFYVPIDDYTSAHWDVRYNLMGPMKLDWFSGENPDDYMETYGDAQNLFHQDRDAMANGSFTGFSSIRHEDSAVGMSQGAIPDRTREYLGSTDISIVRGRRLLMKAARAAAAGETDVGVNTAWDMSELRAVEEVMPPGADWRVLAR